MARTGPRDGPGMSGPGRAAARRGQRHAPQDGSAASRAPGTARRETAAQLPSRLGASAPARSEGAGRLRTGLARSRQRHSGRPSPGRTLPPAGLERTPETKRRSFHRRGPPGVVRGRRSDCGERTRRDGPTGVLRPWKLRASGGFPTAGAGDDLAAPMAPAPAGPPAATAPAGDTAPTPGSHLRRPISGASASTETPRNYRRGNPSDLSPPPAARLRSDVVAAPRARGAAAGPGPARTHRHPRQRTRGHGAFRPREAAWALGWCLRTRVADPRRGRHRCRHREAESGRSRGTPALRFPRGLQVTLTACRDVRDTAQPPWRPCGALLRQLRTATSQDTSAH